MKAILFLKLGEGVFLEVCQYLVSQQQNKKKQKKILCTMKSCQKSVII